MIEEKNPLKQGLKQSVGQHKNRQKSIEEKNPLKQGLKHCVDDPAPAFVIMIEEKNPLKQGLKL